jgi:hypothetical protein
MSWQMGSGGSLPRTRPEAARQLDEYAEFALVVVMEVRMAWLPFAYRFSRATL